MRAGVPDGYFVAGGHAGPRGENPFLGAIVEFTMPSGPASGSTFSGSDPDALPNYFALPDGSYAKFNLTWNLRLVRQ